ncbi:MAG: hypothetical protein EB127_05360, partial [Alphaproteobacteria bacterium]|nr:hypothetical protein [Alphaproteobacteria bacterium]
MATNIRPVKPTPTEHLSEPIINSNRANISANQDTAELPNTKLISGDLSGVDPFEEDNSTRIGTPEFQQKYQGFMQSQDGNNLLGVFDGAVALKAKWQARHTGLPSGESQEEISSNPANFLHPYADFLSSFGGDRMSITAGIARAQSRAAFYADRYSNDPRTKLLLDASTGGDPSLLNNSKAFGQALVKAGVIQSQEEYDFWQKTDGKYHRGYNMSPYVYLKKQFDPENKAPNHIASLKEDLLESGYRLDPDKPEDVDKFIAYRKYIDENSNDYISNAGQMVVGLAGNLQKTIAGNVIALIDPQIDWSPEYKEASGARLEKKQNFLRILAELKNLERTHSSEEAIGLDAKIDLLNRTKGAESFDDFDFDKIDPTTESTKIPEIMLRLNAAYDELDSDGAFYKDIRGITGICQFVSTVLAGLYSMSGFLYSSDPNAWSAKLHSELQDWYAKITTSNKTANGRTFINEADRDNYLLNYGAINQFNSALDLDHDIQKRVQYGILPDVGSRVLDSRFHADQVAIVDPFRGAGKILKLSKALTKNVGIFEKYYQAAETKKMLLALSRVEQIADRGIKFDVAKGLQGDIKLQWTAAKTELEKAAGKPLSDAEVIKGIQTGKVKIPDIKDPTKLVDFPAEGLNQIYDHVSNMSKDVESLRKNLIKIVKNGQKIEYSANSYDTLNLAREMLKKAAPEVDWDKTSDFEIFQRIKEGKIPYSDVEFTPKGTKAVIKTTSGTWAQRTQNLKKEVGETWRKISVNDAAGFKRANSLPIELIYGAGTTGASWALRKGSYGLRSWADSIDSNLSKNIDPSVARVATDTLRDKNGTYIATVASEASKGATQQTIAKAGMLTTFMRGIAVGFDAGEFVSDFIAADGRVSMYGSTFLGMYGEYARKLRELADKKSKIEGIA